jgi:indolepyruvate ferredoxin oxidoreductase
LNGVKVTENLLAFDAGRVAVSKPGLLEQMLEKNIAPNSQFESDDEKLMRYQVELTQYQNSQLAERFKARVLPLRAGFDSQGLNHQWMRLCSTYFKLLAFKDEFGLAGHGNRPRKIKLGPWIDPVLRVLAGMRHLRNTIFDPFRGSLERKNQTLLVTWFETWLELMHNNPSMLQHSKQTDHLLDLFNQVKGFGQVRAQSFEQVRFEIQKSVENKHNLDQHDQSRQQT